MATQLAEAPDNGGNEGGDFDYEAAARKRGWKPPEETGDPEKALDAKTFYERGQEDAPLLKKEVKILKDKLARMEKDMAQSAEFFTKAEERARQSAIADIRREMAEAVETGDAKAGAAALDKMEKLTPAVKPADPNLGDPAKRAEEFADWMTDNRWYSSPDMGALRIYADAQADVIAAGNGGKPLSRSDLDDLAERVQAKYGDKYPEAFGESASKPRPRNPVDGGGSAPGKRGGHTAADLPDGGAQMRRFIKNGLIKDEATYLKSYDWSDKK